MWLIAQMVLSLSIKFSVHSGYPICYCLGQITSCVDLFFWSYILEQLFSFTFFKKKLSPFVGFCKEKFLLC